MQVEGVTFIDLICHPLQRHYVQKFERFFVAGVTRLRAKIATRRGALSPQSGQGGASAQKVAGEAPGQKHGSAIR